MRKGGWCRQGHHPLDRLLLCRCLRAKTQRQHALCHTVPLFKALFNGRPVVNAPIEARDRRFFSRTVQGSKMARGQAQTSVGVIAKSIRLPKERGQHRCRRAGLYSGKGGVMTGSTTSGVFQLGSITL